MHTRRNLVVIICLALLLGPLTLPMAAQAPDLPAGPAQGGSALGWDEGKSPRHPERPTEPAAGEAAAALEVGQQGLSFRYVKTFGETRVPYFGDNEHLFWPSGVTTDAAGNVYVTESKGHRMMKFGPDGTFLMSIGQAGDWLASTNRLSSPRCLALAADNSLWIAEGASRVSHWAPDGSYLGQVGHTWDCGQDNERLCNPEGVAIDSAGRLYVADTENHRIQIFDGAGNYLATLGDTGTCGTGNNQFCYPRAIAVDGMGRLYVADTDNHRIQIYDSSWNYLTTLGKTATCGQANDELCWPRGVKIAPDDGRVVVADTGNNRVQIFSAYPTLVHQQTLGTGEWGADNNQFAAPADVAFGSGGTLYVTDERNERVQVFAASGMYVRTIGVTGVPYLTDSLHYNQPQDVAIDRSGGIVILEGDGQRIIKLNGEGVPQFVVGEAGRTEWGNSHFCWPSHVAVDTASRIYVADNCNNRIQIFGPTGVYLATLGGTWGVGDYEFNGPRGIAVGDDGNVYVADSGNHRVQVYDANLVYVTTLGDSGVPGSDLAHFDWPVAVAVDSAGSVYVADTNNRRVQNCVNGVCSIFAGVTGEWGNDFAHFSEPDDVAVDASGRVYVTDQHNGRVQVFDQSGAYLTTIGGSRGLLTGQLQNPWGIGVDSSGNVYVADHGNQDVRKFAPGVAGWVQVNINGFGDRANSSVYSLAPFAGNLYAGTGNWSGAGAQLWRTNSGTDWTPAATSGLGDPCNGGIDHLLEFKGQLYAGTYNWCWDVNGSDGGQIWRSPDGLDWTQVVDGGFGDPNNGEVFRFAVFGDALYASTWSFTNAHGTEVWRSDTGDSSDWEQVVSNGFNDDPGNSVVYNFEVLDGYLYAATYNSEAGAEIWRSPTGNLGAWTQVNANGFGDQDNHSVGALEALNGYLYASTGHWSDTGGSQIWRCQACDGSDWQKVMDNGFGNPESRGTGALEVLDGKLYCVVDNYVTGLEVWRTANGANWEQVGIPGFGDSNNRIGYADNSITVFNSRLFVGTGNGANGGEIWKKTVTADFSAAPTRGEPPLLVTFNNSSAGDYTTSLWDFGDGQTSTEQSPVHTYDVGVYDVTLTVSDGIDTSTITRAEEIQVRYSTYLPLIRRSGGSLAYDDFDNAVFDGTYNRWLWAHTGEEAFQARQQGGSLVFTNTQSPGWTGGGMNLSHGGLRTLDELRVFQARLKLGSDLTGGWTSLNLDFNAGACNWDHDWFSQCVLGASGGSQPVFNCWIATCDGDCVGEYWTTNVPVAYDTWYTARMEADPATATLSYYLDGVFLGSHTTLNAAALIGADCLQPNISIWNGDPNTYATRYVDDVLITPIGR